MKRNGFVLIELVIVMGMLAVLVGMTTINVFGSRNRATLTGAVDTLMADIKGQQVKAMTGTKSGANLPNGYGIRFSSDRYILFTGLTYSQSDSSNATVTLDPQIVFSTISLPSSQIVFASRSGEFVEFASASSTFSLQQRNSSEIKTFQFNRYGIITAVN